MKVIDKLRAKVSKVLHDNVTNVPVMLWRDHKYTVVSAQQAVGRETVLADFTEVKTLIPF